MENENHIALIESLLEGNIDRDETMRLGGYASEKDLDEAISLYKEGLEDIYDLGLSNNLKEIHQKLYPTKERRLSPQRVVLVAASVILFSVFGFLIFKEANQPVFDDYFELFPNYELSRSKAAGELNKALTLYSQEKFDSAQTVFSSIQMDTLNYDYSFYFGITCLVNGEFPKAITVLKPVDTGKDQNPYYQQTRWYLALAYWQSGQVEKAIRVLESIKAEQYKYEEARELIGLLR